MNIASNDRYSRQERFSPVGSEGQAHLGAARVLICGVGALGSMIAERLARSGVGQLRLVDRDWVELSNLQRQALFSEEDARLSRPKAVAAAETIARFNSEISVEPLVEDVSYQNMVQLANDCELIVDGTDNFETRFLINDYCIEQGIPWIHGGCLGAGGQVMSILPGETACFRCLVPELPSRDSLETCDSAGVLGPAVGLIACWQAAEALKILSGNRAAVCKDLIVLDSWNTECRLIRLPKDPHCPTCGRREFSFLSGAVRTETTVLCGKNAVQLESPNLGGETLAHLAGRLKSQGELVTNPFFVRLQLNDHTITIFKGGRTIVEGTVNPAEAKSILARTIGA
jgi:adenylyltransferase/sulfurtransferase